jgi:hypothetical protein
VNNSKKLQTKKVKEVKISEKPITSISKPWLITSLVIILVLIGALLFDQLYTPNIMSVDGKKYNLRDLSYYFYTTETKYASYDQMFGGGYWDTKIAEDGTTLRQAAKKDAVNESLKNVILYNEAVKKGYKLTPEEIKSDKLIVNKLLKQQISKDEISKNHFTKANLTKFVDAITLITRYHKDQVAAAKLDYDKITASVSKDEFRQYDIEYLFATTQITDADGKTTEMTADQKKAAYDNLKSYYEKAKTAKDWSKVVPTDDTAIIYKSTSFIKSDSSTFSDDFKAQIMKMANNDVSDVHQASTGYFIVRMKNNNSSERYDTEVANAKTKAENAEFDKIYEKVKSTHKFKLNDKAIKKLKMGNLTIIEIQQ